MPFDFVASVCELKVELPKYVSFCINDVNSMPFVKKCENTLDKTTRRRNGVFSGHALASRSEGASLIMRRMSSITLTTLAEAFMDFSTFSMEDITVV